MNEAQHAVVQVVGRNEKAICRSHAMILLAIVALGIMVATHALAAGRGTGGSRPQGYHAGTGFQGSVTAVPSMPTPTLNPSIPYTVPQSPEVPVSPASPGSVFGNH